MNTKTIQSLRSETMIGSIAQIVARLRTKKRVGRKICLLSELDDYLLDDVGVTREQIREWNAKNGRRT